MARLVGCPMLTCPKWLRPAGKAKLSSLFTTVRETTILTESGQCFHAQGKVGTFIRFQKFSGSFKVEGNLIGFWEVSGYHSLGLVWTVR